MMKKQLLYIALATILLVSCKNNQDCFTPPPGIEFHFSKNGKDLFLNNQGNNPDSVSVFYFKNNDKIVFSLLKDTVQNNDTSKFIVFKCNDIGFDALSQKDFFIQLESKNTDSAGCYIRQRRFNSRRKRNGKRDCSTRNSPEFFQKKTNYDKG